MPAQALSDVRVLDFTHYPTSTMERLGISYYMLRQQNPTIIMLRMPAYGSTGPYKNFRGFGLHMESVIGHTSLRGYADMDPSSVTPVLMADAASGAQGLSPCWPPFTTGIVQERDSL